MSDQQTEAAINVLQKWMETGEMKLYDFTVSSINISMNTHKDWAAFRGNYTEKYCTSIWARIIGLRVIIHSVMENDAQYYLIRLTDNIEYNRHISSIFSSIFAAFKHQNIIYYVDQHSGYYQLVNRYVCDILEVIKPKNIIYGTLTDGLIPSIKHCTNITIDKLELSDVEHKDICRDKKITIHCKFRWEYETLITLLDSMHASNHIEIYLMSYNNEKYDISRLCKYSCVKYLESKVYNGSNQIISRSEIEKIQSEARLADLLMSPNYLPLRDHKTLADARLFDLVARFLQK